MVFQMGPGHAWISEAYAASVPRPHGTVIGQDIFQSNIIPSDTDFRIYRDFGHVPGIDLAVIQNGYVYHTRQDLPSAIPPGTLQFGGDNMLALARHLGDSPALDYDADAARHQPVYFDVFETVMVELSLSTLLLANIVTLAAAAFVLYVRGWASLAGAKRGSVDMLMCLAGSILPPMLVGALVMILGPQLSWYSSRPLLLGLFVLPAIAGGVFSTVWSKRHDCSDQQMESDAFAAGTMFWMLLLAVGTAARLASSYLFLAWVAFPVAARLAAEMLWPGSATPGGGKRGKSTIRMLFELVLGQTLPLVLTFTCIFPIFEIFLPLMGRCGTDVPADAVIGALVGLSSFIILASARGHLHGCHLAPLLPVKTVLALVLCAIMLAPLTPPYSVLRPKRLYVQHTVRLVHSLQGGTPHHDSGLWINTLDGNDLRTVAAHLPLLADAEHQVLQDGVYGGFPWLYPVKMAVSRSLYIRDNPAYTMQQPGGGAMPSDSSSPTPLIQVPNAASLQLLSKVRLWERDGRRGVRFTFAASGPDHTALYLQPCQHASHGTVVTGWSLTQEPPRVNLVRRVFLYLASGGPRVDIPHLWVEVEESVNRPVECDASLGVALAGHHLVHSTAELEAVERQLPEWVDMHGWVSTYESWLY